MTRTKEVSKNVRWVKRLHVFMMLIWPVFVVAMAGFSSLLQRIYQKPYAPYHPVSMLLMFGWLAYVFIVMAAIRNYNLQVIATQACDFDAYLECIEYLEKFQFQAARRRQRINRTDAYLLVGNFDAAYQNLMEMRPQYMSCGSRTKMMYDYFWCRFYGELEDKENFRICIDVFCGNWLQNPKVKGRLRTQADRFMQELAFREMMFSGKDDRIKADMTNLYTGGLLASRYEFVRYCYYMGRLEYNRNNLQIAKHWFAQTVSFGLQEYMSSRAEDFLAMLDNMQVPYAAAPPAYNQYYCNQRNPHIAFRMISIVVGLILTITAVIYS